MAVANCPFCGFANDLSEPISVSSGPADGSRDFGRFECPRCRREFTEHIPRGPEQPLARGGSGAHVGQPGREQPFPRPSVLPASSGRGPRQPLIGGQRSYSGSGHSYQSPASSARDLAAIYCWRLPAKRVIGLLVAKFYSDGATPGQRREIIGAFVQAAAMQDSVLDLLLGQQMKYTVAHQATRAAMDETCPMCNQPAIMGPSFVNSGVQLTQFDCPTCSYQWVARQIRDAAQRAEHNSNGRGNGNPRGASAGPRQPLIGERRSIGLAGRQADMAANFLASCPAEWSIDALGRKAMARGLHADEIEDVLGAFQSAAGMLKPMQAASEGAALAELMSAG